MKSSKEWEAMEEELKELLELRAEVSRRIRVLKVAINAHKRTLAHPPDKTNTIAYKMFGKRLRDLTTEELKAYNAQRKREGREKVKDK